MFRVRATRLWSYLGKSMKKDFLKHSFHWEEEEEPALEPQFIKFGEYEFESERSRLPFISKLAQAYLALTCGQYIYSKVNEPFLQHFRSHEKVPFNMLIAGKWL